MAAEESPAGSTEHRRRCQRRRVQADTPQTGNGGRTLANIAETGRGRTPNPGSAEMCCLHAPGEQQHAGTEDRQRCAPA